MKEKWVRINTIEGYEEIRDCYWLSNSDEDKIVNRSIGEIMKSRPDKDGYKIIKLYTKDGKQKICKIHILKASAFLFGPIPLGANVVRHLNDVKSNNRLINLAWGTRSDNNLDCVRNGRFNYQAAAKNFAKGRAKGSAMGGAKTGKKTSKPVRCIETRMIYSSACEASRQLGIDRVSIRYCCIGKRHTAGSLHFEFVDKEVNSNDMECE